MAWELLCLKRKITEQTRRERNNVFSNIRKNITKLRKLKLLLVKSIDVSEMCVVIKLKFHGTDTDTDTDFLADLSADFCSTLAFPREDVRLGCARLHVRVLYMINYRVRVYNITR